MLLTRRHVRHLAPLALLAAIALSLGPVNPHLPAQEATEVKPDGDEGAERPRRRTSRRRSAALAPQAPLGALEIGENSPAKVTAGRIPVRTVLEYIEDATGRLMLFPTVIQDPHFSPDAAVEFLSDVENFDATIARAVLSTNGFVFVDSALENGRQVTYVSHRSSRQAPPPTEIQQVFGPEDDLPKDGEGHGLLVVELIHADVQTVMMALRQVFEVTGGPSARISIVAVPESGQVLINASVANLRTVRQLVAHLDREPRKSEKPAGARGK